MKIQTRSLPVKSLAALEGEAKREFGKIVALGLLAIKHFLAKAPVHPDEGSLKGVGAPKELLRKSAMAHTYVDVPEAVLPLLEEAKNWGKEEFILFSTGTKSRNEQEAEEEARAAENRREELWISLYNEQRRYGLTQEKATNKVLEIPAYRRALASVQAANGKKSVILGRFHDVRLRVTDLWEEALKELPPLVDPMYKDPKKIWELANQHDVEQHRVTD